MRSFLKSGPEASITDAFEALPSQEQFTYKELGKKILFCQVVFFLIKVCM